VGNLSADTASGLARWVSSCRVEGERVRLEVAKTAVLPEIVRYLVAQHVDVYEVIPQRLSLEELFLQIVGEDGGL